MLRGGIPVLRSLELLADQRRFRGKKDMFQRMADVVRAGGTLGQALRAEQKYLPEFFVELMVSAEQAGKFEAALKELAAYYEEMLAIRRSYVSALAYPFFTMLAAFIGVPLVVEFLKSAVGLVPDQGVGELVLWHFIGVFERNISWIVVVIVLARLGLLRKMWTPVATFVPPFRSLTRKLAFARFFRTMAILLDSGMGLVKAVERAAAVSTNPFVRADLLRVVPAIQGGHTLEEAFKQMRWLKPRALNMVRTCEQTGNLETTLNSLAKWYLDEAYHTLKSVAYILETIAIIILAVMIFSGTARGAILVFQDFFNVFGWIRLVI